MIVLYIILSIILIIFILLHFSIVFYVNASDKETDVKVKFVFLKLYPLKEKDKKSKRMSKRKKKKLEKELQKEKTDYESLLKKVKIDNPDILIQNHTSEESTKESKDTSCDTDKDKSEEKQEKESDENKEKLTDKIDDLKNKWESIKPYIPLGKKAVKKLIKAIRIRGLRLDLSVADPDAYECAMLYGKTNIAVYNVLGILTRFFSVSIEHININCRFNSDETEYDFFCKIKIRPSTLIALAVVILVKFIYTNFKIKKQD